MLHREGGGGGESVTSDANLDTHTSGDQIIREVITVPDSLCIEPTFLSFFASG